MFGRRWLTKGLKRNKNRRCDAPRALRRSLGFESLEGREMLSAGNLFSQFVGIVTPSDNVEHLAVTIAPAELQSTSGKAILGFQLRSQSGESFDPASVQITDAAGKAVALLYSKANLAGSTDSVTLAELRQGDYQINVTGTVAARSQFKLDVFLVGDTNGDHVVSRDDVDAIRLCYGLKSGGVAYNLAADANRDGRIDAIDLSYAVRNVAAIPAGPALKLAAAGLPGGGTNDCVAGVTPTRGYDPDAPMRFYESTYGLVQCMEASDAVLNVQGVDALAISIDYVEAAYNNTGGYYSVDDADGGINLGTEENPNFVYPADEEYQDTALDRLHFVNVPSNVALPYEQIIPMAGEDYISFFLMQNGVSVEQVENGEGNIWFAIDTANADGYGHFAETASGDSGYRDDWPQFKVEDLSPTLSNPWGLINDADFDDVVFSETTITVDLDISGLTETTEDTVGGLVVRNYDGNNAPRKQITLSIEETGWSGNVVLSRNNSEVRVFDAATGGNEITFNGTDNIFASSSLPKNLYVEGYSASGDMRDITLTLQPQGLGGEDSVKFTVLWVESVDITFLGDVSNDNYKRDTYKDMTIASTYALGLQEFQGGAWACSYQARGLVVPREFDYPGSDLRLSRDCLGRVWRNNGPGIIAQKDFTGNPPGSDPSPDVLRDDNPTDSDPYGAIYDIDVPGIHQYTAPKDEIQRFRADFQEFAYITVPENNNAKIRCSPITKFYVRFSFQQVDSPTGTNWVQVFDVTGDNDAACYTGSDPSVTWNLQ